MNYTVLWKPAAEEELARIWVAAVDRADVAAAANRMERLLQRNPAAAGESRSGPVRILIDAPLAVHFRVSQPDRQVFVLEVWRSRRAD